MKNVTEIYEALIEYGYFTEDELTLVTNINGYTIETLNDCIYCRYGYHSFDALMEEHNE